MTSIDPETRRVTTDAGSYDADILVVALGADYDFAATPGFEEGGVEYYSVAGAERMRDVLSDFDSGTILLGILGHPFKCPPAPFEGALLLHDHFVERGVRDSIEIRTIGPMAAPVPITKEVSQTILDALTERDIEYVPNQHIVELDTARQRRRGCRAAEASPTTCSSGSPCTGRPMFVERCGLAVDGWVPVEKTNLTTRFPDVYAVGDVTALPMAKAGVFAEAAARVVAEDIAARIHGERSSDRTKALARATSSSAAGWSAWSRPTSSAGRRRRRGSSGRRESSPRTRYVRSDPARALVRILSRIRHSFDALRRRPENPLESQLLRGSEWPGSSKEATSRPARATLSAQAMRPSITALPRAA